jgi:hypothetical protein
MRLNKRPLCSDIGSGDPSIADPRRSRGQAAAQCLLVAPFVAVTILACSPSADGMDEWNANTEEQALIVESPGNGSYPLGYPPGWLRKEPLSTPWALFWDETDGVSPGVDGWHDGFLNSKCKHAISPQHEIGEACLQGDGGDEILETNPGPVCHMHRPEYGVPTGHPDVFSCKAFCTGIGFEGGACHTRPAGDGHVASAHCTCEGPMPCGAPGQRCCTNPTDLGGAHCKVGVCDKTDPANGWICIAGS